MEIKYIIFIVIGLIVSGLTYHFRYVLKYALVLAKTAFAENRHVFKLWLKMKIVERKMNKIK